MQPIEAKRAELDIDGLYFLQVQYVRWLSGVGSKVEGLRRVHYQDPNSVHSSFFPSPLFVAVSASKWIFGPCRPPLTMTRLDRATDTPRIFTHCTVRA